MALSAVADMVRLLERGIRPLPLTGRVQPYDWGGYSFLRDLTGLSLPSGKPAAEWWLGGHPSASSVVTLDDVSCELDALIAAAPDLILGSRVAQRFGPRLPYLLKVLDVRAMLSIQAHPTKQQAEDGFAREEAAGVSRTASHRNYRDDNHKPEAQVALSPFWMLAGFRQPDEMRRILDACPELRPLTAALSGARSPISAMYEHVMRLPQPDIDRMVSALWQRLEPAYRVGALERRSPDFWAARAIDQFRRPDGSHDRGVVSIYLMNLVRLEPGQATFLDAGVLHAYLEGQCVEIMANSDNVIRGGLTTKHVDVEELLRVLRFEPTVPSARPVVDDNGHEEFSLPVAEFGLSRIALDETRRVSCGSHAGPEVLVTIDGAATVEWDSGHPTLPRGSALLLPAGATVRLRSDAPALVFRARVPVA